MNHIIVSLMLKRIQEIFMKIAEILKKYREFGFLTNYSQ